MWGVPATGGGSTPVSPRVTDSVQLGVEVAQQLCGWGCHDLKSSQDALVWQHIARSSSQRTGLQQTCITHTPHQTSYHIRRTSHHTYIASRQTYITSDTHHITHHITSDVYHIRHTSHQTHITSHITLHQTYITSDTHDIRHTSHQRCITSETHHNW